MARLPKVGDDKGTWGGILNEFLEQSHDSDGTLKADTVGPVQLKPDAVTGAALANSSVSAAKIADGAVGTTQLANAGVTTQKLAGLGEPDGVASLDSDGRLYEAQVPERLSESELSASFVDRATAGVVGDEWRLTLAGTQDGGLDGADSTPRITMQSWQSPHGPNVGGFGQGLRLDVMHRFAKNLIVWRVPEDPTQPFNAASNPLQDVLWMGAHYNHFYPENPTDTTNIHGHWSIEVPRAGGALVSRFGLRFIDWTTKEIGTDHAMIDTYAADLVVRAYNAIDTSRVGTLRVAAETNTFANRDKILEFANDPAGGLKQWQIKSPLPQLMRSRSLDGHPIRLGLGTPMRSLTVRERQPSVATRSTRAGNSHSRGQRRTLGSSRAPAQAPGRMPHSQQG